jgi:hypothetical protein
LSKYYAIYNISVHCEWVELNINISYHTHFDARLYHVTYPSQILLGDPNLGYEANIMSSRVVMYYVSFNDLWCVRCLNYNFKTTNLYAINANAWRQNSVDVSLVFNKVLPAVITAIIYGYSQEKCVCLCSIRICR